MNLRTFYSNWLSPQRWLERAGVRAPMRIAMGLVLLTAAILLTAKDIKILPDPYAQLVQTRVALAEMESRQVASAISRSDDAAIQDLLNGMIGHNDVLSAGLRAADGTIVAQTPDHKKFWAGAQPDVNTPTHIQLALSQGQRNWGQLEIAFAAPPGEAEWKGWWLTPAVQLIVFVTLAEFLLFWVYLSRMLTMLDPSAVIPNRLQLLMDTLVEGMVVLDGRGYIVMTNLAFAQTAFTSVEQLIGRKLSSLSWLAQDGDGDPGSYPWDTDTHNDLQQRGVPIRLGIGKRHTRRLNVNASPVLGPDGKRRGTIVTFDDQTAVEEDNLQLSQLVASVLGAGQRIRQLQEMAESQTGIDQLDKLRELARTASELTKLCESTTLDNAASVPAIPASTVEMSQINRADMYSSPDYEQTGGVPRQPDATKIR